MEEFLNQLVSALKGIWNHRWHALAVTWLVALAGWARVYTLPDDYQSTARVFVDTQSILKPLMQGMTQTRNTELEVDIMSKTLISRPNVERVMRMVDLDVKVKSPREKEELTNELMREIRIAGTSATDIYTISYHNKDPKLVRDVVQSLLAIFLEGSFRGNRGESEKAVQFIDDQIRSYEARLVEAENAVKEFKLRNTMLLPRQGTDYSSQLGASADALGTARLELQEAEQARNAIKAQISGDEPVLGLEAKPADIVNPEIDSRIEALNKNLDLLRMQYTEAHPDIVAGKRLIAQLEARKLAESREKGADADPGRHFSPMLQQLKVALTEADAKVAAMRARVQEYTARHERLLAQSNAIPEIESQLAQLNRDYLINKDNYEKLIAKREAAKLSGELTNTTEMMSFKIIDPPTLPQAPVGPNRPMLYSAVLLAALFGGPAAGLLISQVRPTFLGPAAMRQVTGLNVIGTVALNWTARALAQRRRGHYVLAVAVAALLAAYGGFLATALSRH
ncbi:XrtA system polysaccharide chain length determinant [Pseudoduganella sp. GCM10020061]|uniref:XrtA system polysaccharide chain length determinant n=1 Tax=Pseudoduganella sp. GCM10020061 TaxID=3317345 RepID=UPI0036347733